MFNPKRVLTFLGKVLRFAFLGIFLLLVSSFLAEYLTYRGEKAFPWQDPRFWLAVLVDLVPAGAISVAMYWLAGRFVKALYHLDKMGDAVWFLLKSRFGLPSFSPWMKLDGGKITDNAEGMVARMGGPGHLIIYNNNVAVLQKAGRLTRVVGPGFIKLEPFEQVYDIVDLRPKRWVYTVSAITRDAIRIEIKAEVWYKIADGDQSPTKDVPYPYLESEIFKAVSKRWIFVGRDTQMDWEGLVVISRTEGKLRSILAQKRLDELVHNKEQVEEQLGRELAVAAVDIGAKIVSVRLDDPQVKDLVREAWFRVWRAGWQSWSAEELAKAEAERVRRSETIKARAQLSLIIRITQELDALSYRELVVPRIVIMRLFSVLDHAAFEASTRVFFPKEAFQVLDNMQKVLLPPAKLTIKVSVDPVELMVGGQKSKVIAKLRDSSGHDAPDGTLVEFRATLGTLSTKSVAASRGRATTVFKSETTAGNATITAGAQGVLAKAQLSINPAMARDIELSAVDLGVCHGAHCYMITAIVKDKFGNKVSDGIPVRLCVVQSDGRERIWQAMTIDGGVERRVAFRNGSDGHKIAAAIRGLPAPVSIEIP